jgi:hypothetical protein
MQVALNKIIGPEAVNVTKSMSSQRISWLVTFVGPSVEGPVSLLKVQGAPDFVGENTNINVTEILAGNKPSGMIEVNIGSRKSLRVDVDYNSDELLRLLRSYGVNVLSVDIDYFNSSRTWTIVRRLIDSTDAAILTSEGNATGIGLQVLSSIEIPGSIPLSGSFTLAYASNSKKIIIAYNDSAEALKDKLMKIDSSLFSGCTVTTTLTDVPPLPFGVTKIYPKVSSPYPIFEDIGNGARNWDIVLSLQKSAPELLVFSKSLDGSGGSIHVITRKPVQNKLRRFHLSFAGVKAGVDSFTWKSSCHKSRRQAFVFFVVGYVFLTETSREYSFVEHLDCFVPTHQV